MLPIVQRLSEAATALRDERVSMRAMAQANPAEDEAGNAWNSCPLVRGAEARLLGQEGNRVSEVDTNSAWRGHTVSLPPLRCASNLGGSPCRDLDAQRHAQLRPGREASN
jgi:hypothetical protein